jgi:hypothetical protein
VAFSYLYLANYCSSFCTRTARAVQKLKKWVCTVRTVLVQKLNNNSHSKCKSKSPKTFAEILLCNNPWNYWILKRCLKVPALQGGLDLNGGVELSLSLVAFLLLQGCFHCFEVRSRMRAYIRASMSTNAKSFQILFLVKSGEDRPRTRCSTKKSTIQVSPSRHGPST